MGVERTELMAGTIRYLIGIKFGTDDRDGSIVKILPNAC